MNAVSGTLREELEGVARAGGAALFGVADLVPLLRLKSDLCKRVGEGFTRAIVVGIRLQDAVLEGVEDRPTPLYFHNYRQVNYQLDSTALLVANRLQERGARAAAVAASQILTRDPMTGHISHRHLGWAAGLGHIGRNNLLVNDRYGARVRYVSVLTDAALSPDSPGQTTCGTCTACVASCPAKAIRERCEDFDLEACYQKLNEFARMPFVGQHICGVCVKACRGTDRG